MSSSGLQTKTDRPDSGGRLSAPGQEKSTKRSLLTEDFWSRFNGYVETPENVEDTFRRVHAPYKRSFDNR